MILGIGTDIVDVERIKQKVTNREGFQNLVFSKNEIAYCDKNKNPFENYAARFAAKEAFLKALGTGLTLTFELNEIEIQNEISGKPTLVLSSTLQDRLKEIFKITAYTIHI